MLAQASLLLPVAELHYFRHPRRLSSTGFNCDRGTPRDHLMMFWTILLFCECAPWPRATASALPVSVRCRVHRAAAGTHCNHSKRSHGSSGTQETVEMRQVRGSSNQLWQDAQILCSPLDALLGGCHSYTPATDQPGCSAPPRYTAWPCSPAVTPNRPSRSLLLSCRASLSRRWPSSWCWRRRQWRRGKSPALLALSAPAAAPVLLTPRAWG